MDIIRYELVEQVLAAGKENPTIVKTLVVIGGLLIWSKLPKSSKIPGPPTIPLIGNYQMIAHSFSRTVNEYFIKLNNQYGPLVELKQMTLTNYVVADAYEVKRILTDTTTFSRSELFQQIGSGLFHHALFVLPSGEQWKRHRKLIQPAFGPTHLRHAALVSVETMGELITTLDAMFTDSDTVKVNMHGALTATALDVV
ncbi:cytochrome P450 [Globomyces pollinis-pini]|nr:cytochrome P450 [Globomyces pollinis-pini]